MDYLILNLLYFKASIIGKSLSRDGEIIEFRCPLKSVDYAD